MQATKPTHVRYLILLMLFLVTTINYADRATIAIAGSSLQKDLGIDAVTLGYIFSAFGWAYVAGQIPGGWLLDRFGSKKVYALSIFTWSLFTVLQGYVGEFGVSTAVVALFMLRFMVGLAEAPSFPGNARIVAAWFPTAERGTASAIFNSAQYFATVLFAPLMGWIVYSFGWQHVFIVMGVIGILFSLIWLKVIHQRCEQHRGEVLRRVEDRRSRTALSRRKPRRDNTGISGKRRRFGQAHHEAQHKQRHHGGGDTELTDITLQHGEQ